MALRERASTDERLPPKLEAVLGRLCTRAPKPLSITQAVKMPYLVNVLAHRVLGHVVTEGHHEAWDHGVVTAEAWRFLHACPPGSGFRVTPVPYSEEIRVEAVEEASEADLSPEEQRIVDFVAEEYSFVTPTELGEMTKRMNPALRAWGESRAADVGGDAYERMTPEYLEMSESVARVTLDQLRKSSRPVSSPEDVLG